MPLKPGNSHEAISANIASLVKVGHPISKAVSLALSHAHHTKNLAGGGDVSAADPQDPNDPTVPEPDPDAALAIQRGATESGWRPAEYWHNLLQGLGFEADPNPQPSPVVSFADGGDVSPDDLATLQDMFGSNSPSLNDALNQSREQAVQQLADQVPLSNDIQFPLANKSAAESAEVLGGADEPQSAVPDGSESTPLAPDAEAPLSGDSPL